MSRLSPRFRTSTAAVASVAAALAISVAGAPAASAQQFFFPGSSTGFTIGAQCTEPELDPTSAEYRSQLAEATNAARVENGRQPLRVNDALSQVATDWSGVQADQNRMYHNSDVGEQIPPGFAYWGENVLQNYECATPEELVDQWMASFAHRVNLLRTSHTDVGVGVAVADDGKLYATQVFARY